MSAQNAACWSVAQNLCKHTVLLLLLLLLLALTPQLLLCLLPPN
jgi:hypothetical protein